jgi:CubicO group peptidase (beta-lactamase class C family)
MPFHLGYHESPIPGLLKGFGHIGLGGTLGWADPASGSAFAFVHNRLLTPMVLDMASFAGLARPMRNAITAARHAGPLAVPRYGARYRHAATKPPRSGSPDAANLPRPLWPEFAGRIAGLVERVERQA